MRNVSTEESLLEDMLDLEDSPIQRWNARYDEWKRMIARFRSVELSQLTSQSPGRLQGHRQAIYLLLGHGAHLAIGILRDDQVVNEQKQEFLRRLDTHLGCLHTALDTWHGMPPSPETIRLLDEAFTT
jgi:hypothetical protein